MRENAYRRTLFPVLCRLVLSVMMVAETVAVCRAEPETIVLEGDVWPPYVMDSAEGRQGFMVDVAKAALAKSGYAVRYANMPWSRVLKETEEGLADGAVGIYFTEAREKNFIVPAEEIGVSVNKFYVVKGSVWRYSGPQSLAAVVLGVIDGYDYGEINAYLREQRRLPAAKVDVTFGDKALERNFRKLLAGRIGATVDDQLVVAFVSARLGIADKIQEAGTVAPANKVGIAFSPVNPLAGQYATALSDGILAMRASGELRQILSRYDVNDWK